MILPYVYKLTNPSTGEFYFGFRMANKLNSSQDLGVHYFTSSKYVKPRFKEFTYEILAEFFDPDSAYWFEQKLIEENWGAEGLLNKKYIKSTGKSVFYSTKNTEEQKRKISASLKGRPKTEAHRKASGDAQKGKKLSESHKENLRKPKTVIVELKAQWEKLKNPDSLSKPRKCSCLLCHKQTSTNQINKHYTAYHQERGT